MVSRPYISYLIILSDSDAVVNLLYIVCWRRYVLICSFVETARGYLITLARVFAVCDEKNGKKDAEVSLLLF